MTTGARGEIRVRGQAWRAVWTLAVLAGCGDGSFVDRVRGPGNPEDASPVGEGDASDEERDAATEDASSEGSFAGKCVPPRASDDLPAREVAMSDVGSSGSRPVFTSVLFNDFKATCGTCHADNAVQGGLNVNLSTFPEKITQESLDRIRSDDPEYAMPPPSDGDAPFSERGEDDPLVAFAGQIEAWLAAGSPADVFYPSAEGDAGGSAHFRLSREVGMQLTNLGNCIPEADMVGRNEDDMRSLDARFGRMRDFEDLPDRLEETDLTTFDTAELAQRGVIPFAPAYTLFADNAKKIRYIRVPRGKSVEFDKRTQSFEIPSNTRFYKTFLIKVVDLDGNVRYRKMETRIIVTRPNADTPDGRTEPRAIFGTYKWNEDETEAVLLRKAYRDGEGFQDDVQPYVIDEQIEDQVLREGPADLAAALVERGASRHYAIPGFDRCGHCHMGSPNQDFSLGFIPLQIWRRPLGEGGVIEPALRDELNQLDRLIEYGVITGLDSSDDVRPLEESQGDREPRNEHELAAQGYMLGNCAHCHNPRGFPSQREPVLSDVLNFLPGPEGGIFQFPLDRTSPRTFRGTNQDITVPYITPSLFDHPLAVMQEKTTVPPGSLKSHLATKWIFAIGQDHTPERLAGLQRAWDQLGAASGDLPSVAEALAPDLGRPLLAPWRSLVYRNVDAPFSYQDGVTIFPHMPMDIPGYDCRARRLLGSWMTSIPAARSSTDPGSVPASLVDFREMGELADQPYVEVLPDEDGYESAAAAAEARLSRFRGSERYHDCPDALDIVDPAVQSGSRAVPRPHVAHLSDASGNVIEEYTLWAPTRQHYPVTDLREAATWSPRRGNWIEVLAEPPYEDPTYADATAEKLRLSQEVIDIVRAIEPTEAAKNFALEPQPFGLWKPKDGCEGALAQQPTVAQVRASGDALPLWMQDFPPEDDAPVFEISRGGQVFHTVCAKCHGLEGNGVSALASTMADLTGGLTRVANLRDGLFGPADDPGAHRASATFLGDSLSAEDADTWATRYLIWMGLGGTLATIPETVLALIGSADVLGASRPRALARITGADAANMLSVARAACEVFLNRGVRSRRFDVHTGALQRRDPDEPEAPTLAHSSPLIIDNGDAELWRSVCGFDNPLPLRMVEITGEAGEGYHAEISSYTVDANAASTAPTGSLVRRGTYPRDRPVGTHEGETAASLTDENLAPWCALGTAEDIEGFEQQEGVTLPRCPEGWQSYGAAATGDLTFAEASAWTTRGAANAGLFVFLYLDALARGEVKPTPTYDACENLVVEDAAEEEE